MSSPFECKFFPKATHTIYPKDFAHEKQINMSENEKFYSMLCGDYSITTCRLNIPVSKVSDKFKKLMNLATKLNCERREKLARKAFNNE